VTSADTLVGIALRYDVSVPALKKWNSLPSNEVWFKDEIIVPRTRVADSFRKMDDSIVDSATKAGQVSALVRTTGVDSGTARDQLDSWNGDFGEALTMCNTMIDLERKYGLSAKEVTAYLLMHDNDLSAALEEIEEGLQWERDEKRRQSHCFPAALSFSSNASSYRRLICTELSPREIELKKRI